MKVTYLKIRADFKYATKGRFYRTFLVRDDINLRDLGEFMVYILGGALEHYYLFVTKDSKYEDSEWIEERYISHYNEYSYDDYDISVLPQNFEFDYDTGEGYDFNCKIYKAKVIKDIDEFDDVPPTGFVLEGAGMGIWEDNIGTLYMYLEGKIDKDYNRQCQRKGIFKPWNHKINKYSEFDNPIDIDELNEEAMYYYLDNTKEYIEK